MVQGAEQVLPATMFCVGRHYVPVPGAGDTCDLATCHQAQAVQLLGVSLSAADMEAQLAALLETLISLLSGFPNLSITEEALLHCDPCNSRQFRVEMKVCQLIRAANAPSASVLSCLRQALTPQ